MDNFDPTIIQVVLFVCLFDALVPQLPPSLGGLMVSSLSFWLTLTPFRPDIVLLPKCLRIGSATGAGKLWGVCMCRALGSEGE